MSDPSCPREVFCGLRVHHAFIQQTFGSRLCVWSCGTAVHKPTRSLCWGDTSWRGPGSWPVSMAGPRGPEVTELGVVPRPDADPTAVGPGMGVQGLPGSSSRASWNTPGGSPAAEGTESLTAEADGDVSAGVTRGSGLEADPAAGTAASPTHGLTSAAHKRRFGPAAPRKRL